WAHTVLLPTRGDRVRGEGVPARRIHRDARNVPTRTGDHAAPRGPDRRGLGTRGTGSRGPRTRGRGRGSSRRAAGPRRPRRGRISAWGCRPRLAGAAPATEGTAVREHHGRCQGVLERGDRA